jgi:hypothetical protein
VVFAEYAASASWTAVHLGQFGGMAVIIAGLLVLYFALDVRAGGAAWRHDWAEPPFLSRPRSRDPRRSPARRARRPR